MLIAGFPAGAFQTNCFVVADDAGEPCLVVDPGQDAEEPLTALLAEHRLNPVAVLLTHGHFDHTFSVTPVCDGNDIPAWIHPGDRELLSDPLKGLSSQSAAFFGGRIEMREPRQVRELGDGETLDIAGIRLLVEHTPGHTPGSVIFSGRSEEGAELILAGDTLFAGSIGRTDLPGGNHEQMMASLRDTVLGHEDAALVLPGHGATTTIGAERAGNPFLRGVSSPAPGRGL